MFRQAITRRGALLGTTLTVLLILLSTRGPSSAEPKTDHDIRQQIIVETICVPAQRETIQTIENALAAERNGDFEGALIRFRGVVNEAKKFSDDCTKYLSSNGARAAKLLAQLKVRMMPEQIVQAEKTADIEDAVAAMREGTKENYETALRLLRPLAKQGDARAERFLGDLYYSGHGVPEDKVEAARWYLKAAEQGYTLAQRYLGVLYKKGIGVFRDIVRADMWLTLAAVGGDESAANERDEIESHMTAAQIAEAEKLAREWKPNIASGRSALDLRQPPR
jgi:uncharacterized protein